MLSVAEVKEIYYQVWRVPLLSLVEYYLVSSTTQTPIKEQLVLNRYSLALVL